MLYVDNNAHCHLLVVMCLVIYWQQCNDTHRYCNIGNAQWSYGHLFVIMCNDICWKQCTFVIVYSVYDVINLSPIGSIKSSKDKHYNDVYLESKELFCIAHCHMSAKMHIVIYWL